MLDTTRARGKEFVKLFNEDVVSKYMKLPVFPNVPQTIYSLESLLNSENYKSANDEYQRLKRERKKIHIGITFLMAQVAWKRSPNTSSEEHNIIFCIVIGQVPLMLVTFPDS